MLEERQEALYKRNTIQQVAKYLRGQLPVDLEV